MFIGKFLQLSLFALPFIYDCKSTVKLTRMHSSRMCTTHTLTIFPGSLPPGGLPSWGVCLPGNPTFLGGLHSWGSTFLGGLPSWGFAFGGGGSAFLGFLLPRPSWGLVCPPCPQGRSPGGSCQEGRCTPYEQRDACENFAKWVATSMLTKPTPVTFC